MNVWVGSGCAWRRGKLSEAAAAAVLSAGKLAAGLATSVLAEFGSLLWP